MAKQYDQPGTFYDDPQVFYDGYELPQPKTTNMANKIKLNLARLNVAETVDLATVIKTKFTGHTVFTDPDPTVPNFGTAITTLTAKNDAYLAAKAAADHAMTERDDAQAVVHGNLRSWAAYAESKTKEAAMLQSGGFSLRSPRTPITSMIQVQNVSLTSGDNDGELDAQWDGVRGAKAYEIQVSTDPNNSALWNHKMTVSKSRATISGLSIGTRVWVRVRAIGSSANSAWSDPATKLVS